MYNIYTHIFTSTRKKLFKICIKENLYKHFYAKKNKFKIYFTFFCQKHLNTYFNKSKKRDK